MAQVRVLEKCRPWLKDLLSSIVLFYEQTPTLAEFRNYEWLPKHSASLMCLTHLSERSFACEESRLPPHKLQFDLQGVIYFENHRIIIEGGEVKSSSNSESTSLHIKCFY